MLLVHNNKTGEHNLKTFHWGAFPKLLPHLQHLNYLDKSENKDNA